VAVPSHASVEDARAYYRKILPFYEKEAIAPARLRFWRDLAARERPGRILELGSGLGRITRALSRQAPAVGIDVSHEMLARAAKARRRAPRATFVAADMREAVFNCRFDLIVAPSDPFCHLTALRDRRRALRRVAYQLSARGRFVVEGLCRRRGQEYPPRRIAYGGGVLRVEEEWEPSGRRDLWRARYRFRDTGAGAGGRTLDATFTARAWNPGEVRSLFASCGLRVVNLWGDFDRRPFGPGMNRLIIVARRSPPARRDRTT
jgi:SAM-dependent methyltransferase